MSAKKKDKGSAPASPAASSASLHAGAGLAALDDARHLAAPLFEFRSVHNFGAAGYREEVVNMKRLGKKSGGKFKALYMVLFQEYVLFYALPSSKVDAHSRPASTAHPGDWLRLDTFNYHTLTERVKESGLVPKKEVFTNALALGTDESEMIVECATPESCDAWADAIRTRSKDCLKAVKELGGRNAKDVMVEIRVAVPEIPLWKKGPNENTDESVAHWTKNVKEGWAVRAKYLTLAKGFALYSQFADYRRYFVWYCTPSNVSLASLEGDLLTTEDAVLGEYRRQFTDRAAANAKLKKLDTLSATELQSFQKMCDEMLQRMGWYNAFLREVHGSEAQYEDDAKKWHALRSHTREEEERRSKRAKDADDARKAAAAQEQARVQQQQQPPLQRQGSSAPGTPVHSGGSLVRTGSAAVTPSSSSKGSRKAKKPEDDPFGDVELKHI